MAGIVDEPSKYEGHERIRIAALVALCEEVLGDFEGVVWDNRGTGQPAVDAWIGAMFDEYRARLAQLRGDG